MFSQVYDVSSFLNDHPGGRKVLLKHAGTDATKAFDAFHQMSVLEKYGDKLYKGDLVQKKDSDTEPEGTSSQDDTFFGSMVPFADPYWYAGWHSPYYKDSHRALRKAVRQFVEAEIMPFCHEWDEAKQLPHSLYTKMAEKNALLGVIGAPCPAEYQNSPMIFGVVPPIEFDFFHWYIFLDEISRCGSGGVCWGVSAGFYFS